MLAIVPWAYLHCSFQNCIMPYSTMVVQSPAEPNARHHNYSQILRVFPKNLLTIPAVLCDNRIIEQLPNRKNLWQYRIILSADTASEVRQMPSQKRR